MMFNFGLLFGTCTDCLDLEDTYTGNCAGVWAKLVSGFSPAHASPMIKVTMRATEHLSFNPVPSVRWES